MLLSFIIYIILELMKIGKFNHLTSRPELVWHKPIQGKPPEIPDIFPDPAKIFSHVGEYPDNRVD